MKKRRSPAASGEAVTGPSYGKNRVLTSAELALWRAVTAHVTPRQSTIARKISHKPHQTASLLSQGAATETPHKTSAAHQAPDMAPASLPSVSLPIAKKPLPGQSLKPLMTIDPRMKRELTRGRLSIDARLDLHGCRAEEAHQRLVEFLISAQRNGARMVLIVTGKGGRLKTENHSFDSFRATTGILRRQAPLWLADPRLRSVVGGFSESAQTHGGAGALYVRLRRR